MAKADRKSKRGQRRSYSEEFKQEAVQMLLDGYTASSVADMVVLSFGVLLGTATTAMHWDSQLPRRAKNIQR